MSVFHFIHNLRKKLWLFIKQNAEALIVIELALALLGGFWGWVEFGYYLEDRKHQREATAYELLANQSPGDNGKSWALEYLYSRNKDLSYLQLPDKSILRNIDLTGAKLDHLNCNGCLFDNVNFSSAILRESDLVGTTFKKVVFDEANLKNVQMNRYDYKYGSDDDPGSRRCPKDLLNIKGSFVNTELKGVAMMCINFHSSDFSGARFGGNKAIGSNFKNTNISQAQAGTFSECVYKGSVDSWPILPESTENTIVICK